ncbi:MAG: radical SAM protein [Candidatus Omnitrophota bacterium]
MLLDNDRIIRKTKSICPECHKQLEAYIIERTNEILLIKSCPVHGDYKAVYSRSPGSYRSFQEAYIPLMCRKQADSEIEVVLTYKCNMTCPICYWGKHKDMFIDIEPTFDELAQLVKTDSKRIWRFTFTGGEPTLRSDLPQIIRMFKKHGRGISINTNGIKLADPVYAQQLKDTGIDRVNIQLDGFDQEMEIEFRGENYLPLKFKALDNLKKLQIPTGINAVISRDMGETQINNLLNFAIENKSVKSLTWLTLVCPGKEKKDSLPKYIMADEVLDLIEKQTAGKLSKQNFLILRKFYLITSLFFNRGSCRYSHMYILFRKNNSYEGIDHYLNLASINCHLDTCYELHKKNKILGWLFFVFCLPFICLYNSNSFGLLKEFFASGISFFMGNNSYLKPANLLYLRVITICDVHNFDEVGGQCAFGIALKDKDKLYKDKIRNVNIKISK